MTLINSQVGSLAKALILKHGTRLKDKFQAQLILEDMVDYAKVTYPKHWAENFPIPVAIQHLCEILLIELQINDDPDVLAQIKTLNLAILDLQHEEKFSFDIIIHAFILQAKISLLEADIEQSYQLLQEARTLTQAKQSVIHEAKIKTELELLEKEAHIWKDSSANRSSMYQKIAQLKLLEYVKNAQKTMTNYQAGV